MKKIILIAGILLLQYSGIAQEKIGIATDLPRTTLDVNGKLTVRDTGYMENAGHIKPLYVDDQTGLIGTIPTEAPTAATTILVAKDDKTLEATLEIGKEFNKGEVNIRVPMDEVDFTTNNLGLKIINNSVEIQENGTYQINTYLNIFITTRAVSNEITVYFPDVTGGKPKTPYQTIVIPSNNIIFLYAKLYTNGTVTAGTRPLITSVLTGGQANLINLPTATVKLKKGDKLSLAFSRTKQVIGTVESPAGNDVTKIGLGHHYGARPYSISITKL
ncbi:hypothetical protein [Myroides injenensis]|uniref:hypothetical protein n=1 Tax=Myroides injenensis TaxID=1183151 RepID=UPI00226E49CF|nr:hypothetical protein [Myroides injenensis]